MREYGIYKNNSEFKEKVYLLPDLRQVLPVPLKTSGTLFHMLHTRSNHCLEFCVISLPFFNSFTTFAHIPK